MLLFFFLVDVVVLSVHTIIETSLDLVRFESR
jgi:hypothetical protein